MRKYIINYIDADEIKLNSDLWSMANVTEIDVFNWTKEFSYAPKTQIRLLYNEKGIALRFDVEEENILGTQTKFNSPVCRDSCVEWFFSPCNGNGRYFNFEINVFGTLLLGICSGEEDISFLDINSEIFDIEPYLNGNKWAVKLFIPFSFIKKYFSEISNTMKGNFQKCADMSKTPHRGTWNEIKTETSRFHLPEFFGEIEFSKGG